MTRFLVFFFFLFPGIEAFATIYFPNTALRDSLLAIVQTAEKEELADAYNQLALYYNIVDPSKSIEYVELALSVSNEIGYKAGISFALKEKGMNALHARDIVGALTLVEEAREIAGEIGDYKLQGQALHCMGLIYTDFEFFEIAGDYYKQAIEAYKLGKDPDIIVYAYYDMADLYFKRREYDLALQFAMQCQELSQKLNFLTDKGPVHLLIGKIYSRLQQDSLAFEKFQIALELIEKENYHEQIRSVGYFELGSYYLRQHNYPLAYQYLQSAKSSVENGPNLLLEGNVLANLAEVFQLQGAYRQALPLIDSALNIAVKTHSMGLQSKALFVKASINKSMGMEAEAFRDLLTAYAIKDSVSSVGFRSLIADKVTSFETQKAKSQIQSLNSELQLKRSELNSKKDQLNLYLLLAIFFVAGIAAIFWNLMKTKRLTHQLTAINRYVKQQNVELIKLNEEKNNLIKLVAHDMRSPLNNIVSIAELMKKENVSKADRDEYLQLIDNICGKLDHTIAKFLDARLGFEKTHILLPELFNVYNSVEELIREYGAKAATKNIKINLHSSGQKVEALTDKSYTLQIASNLLSNALKFSPPKSTIDVKVLSFDDQFFISIQDEGPGISSAEQQSLFKMYATTSNKPTNNEPSTGLGLAIAKQMAESLGGTITLDSEKGVGSVFTVEIPLVLEHANELASKAGEQQTTHGSASLPAES